MKKLLASLPSDLRVVTNFGLVDICPLRSGKHNAAAFLAREHFDIPLANCASMGDDDNDIALVSAEEHVFGCAGLSSRTALVAKRSSIALVLGSSTTVPEPRGRG